MTNASVPGIIDTIETRSVGNIVYYLPADEDQIKLLINEARNHSKQIRVRGSYHSVQEAVDPSRNGIYVMLSKMYSVSINTINETVTVQAGCHLGYDKVDPTGISTPENNLFAILDAAGYAMSDMGGIIHQTVAGFLSTGASGGSLTKSFGDSLLAFTFIPANSDNPATITAGRSGHNSNLFHAAGVSMGLLGIITSATFSIEKKYDIRGTETTTTVNGCAIDMSGKNPASKISLRDLFLHTDFKRVLWYPQPRVRKVVVWQAGKMSPAPYREIFRKAYKELTIKEQKEAGFIFKLIGTVPAWLKKCTLFNNIFYNFIHPLLLNQFVKVDKKDPSGNPIPVKFEDNWYAALPMDNAISDTLFPVRFTELWITFDDHSLSDRVAEVLQTLNNFFDTIYKNGHAPFPGGAFSVELEVGKKSDFWMSPGYGNKNSIRVDVFWFGKNAGSPSDSYYPLFWNALAGFNFRCHWGKYLPDGDSAQGWEYLKPLYPKWDDFMNLRKQLDPMDIFLSDYWRNHLGL